MNFNTLRQALLGLGKSGRAPRELYPHRVYRLLKERGFDPDSLSYIHTAGSKGKGSLSRTAFSLLRLQGISAGLFTSPHIFSITERLETSEGVIGEGAFDRLAEEFMPLFEREQLHFFEALLFMALVYFIREGCTHAVLEVGVGGRFDPTNFCRPALVLMGHISMEHREFLGGSLESIAFDKAGVLKEGVRALSLDQCPEVEGVFLKEGARLSFLKDVARIKALAKEPGGSLCTLELGGLGIENLRLHRLGKAALENFALAAAGLRELFPGLSAEQIRRAAEEPIPCRLQRIGSRLLADTAHNGQSFLNLCEALDEWLGWKNITLYISLMEGKEYGDVAAALRGYRHLWKEIVVFEFPLEGGRRSEGKEIFALLGDLPARYVGLLDEKSPLGGGEDPVVWAGSFYSIELLAKILGAHWGCGEVCN